MKIALTLVLALALFVCEASASSASGALGEHKIDDALYFEEKLRVLVFSIQQIVSEAGAGAPFFIAAADKLETSLNRGKLAELWSKLKVEILKEPFDDIIGTEDLLEEFDPNLENLGTRGRTFARYTISTILNAINTNPNFPVQSISNDPSVAALFDTIYMSIIAPLALIFTNYTFLVQFAYFGPIFPLTFVFLIVELYKEKGYSDKAPLNRIWSIVQDASQYIQEFGRITLDDFTQFFKDFALNVNPAALPYFQIVQAQITETFFFYLNSIGEPFNLPGFVQVAMKIFQKAFDAIRTIVPKFLDQSDLWLTAYDLFNDVTEEYLEEFNANGEPDVTAANIELYYIGLIDKVLEMSIFQ